MIRIKDPEKSLAFYRDVLGMTHVDTYHFDKWDFSLYFMQSLPAGETYNLEPGSPEAHKYLWSTPGVTLELTHNHGSEKDDSYSPHVGNQENDGFGHLAVSVEDLNASCDRLEEKGVAFRKRPSEGRMSGIAFIYDPDGYFVEVVPRKVGAAPGAGEFLLAQTMLRVKDPEKTVPFYEKHFGMTLVRAADYGDFSNFFMATLPEELKSKAPDPRSAEAKSFIMDELYPRAIPVLELTHNHGTESQPEFKHRNGNVEPHRGFGHIGYLVDDVYAASEAMEAAGVEFHKRPDEGGMKGLAFALDPDGYWIEIIKRGQEGKF